jgi:hypothetical protein
MLLKFHSKSIVCTFALLSFLVFFGNRTSGQNLIGYNYKEIRNYMKENRSDMSMNRVVNNVYKYMKFSDFAETQTILFFLTPDSLCSSVRVIFASNMLAEKIKELNTQFKKMNNDVWVDCHGGKNFLVKLTEDKWSCTITYESEKK